MQLQRGEKRGLSELGIGTKCAVKVDFGLGGVDIAAFGLNSAKVIGDDRYVVLFSNTSSPEGAIQLQAYSDTATFTLDLDRLPTSIDRIVFTATHDKRPIAESRPLVVSINGNQATFDVSQHLTTEKAVMMIEIYRHFSGWKIGTIAAGFAGGLAALIAHFGGEVADAPAAAPAPTPPPPPPPPPAAPVSLKKISLEKNNSVVSLKKTGETFGEIILNLNWNQGSGSSGFFGGSKKVDLDLGVLFELDDGYRGVVQALGRTFGSYHEEPWIELSGDDRTGAVTGGETIRVNGRFFDRIKRIGVFALIYEGAPNWQKTDGVVKMNIPGQPEIEVRMNEGHSNKRLCGVAVIDNVDGELQMQRHMKYYPSQKEFADAVGIYLNWVGATKD
ncbi:TerD family protein [Sphingomonas sp. 179-I 2A4 NHS]|uniref:TerD family protein n=1 Tax=unclassified Sphingomonas TaxID=196159 RepID=UPI00387955DF